VYIQGCDGVYMYLYVDVNTTCSLDNFSSVADVTVGILSIASQLLEVKTISQRQLFCCSASVFQMGHAKG
jgi:hypothetical protein